MERQGSKFKLHIKWDILNRNIIIQLNYQIINIKHGRSKGHSSVYNNGIRSSRQYKGRFLHTQRLACVQECAG